MGYLQMTRNVESIFGAVVTAPHQIPYTYTATGGETFISLPFYPVTGFITINGGVQVPVDNYEIDGNTVNLGRSLEPEDVVYCLFDKILSPEDYENGIRIYKFQAVGNETFFTPDFTSYGVQSLYIDGKFQVPGVDYDYNSATGVVSFLNGSPTAGVWVVAEMSIKQNYLALSSDGGASLVGTSSGNTVQEELNAINDALDNVDDTLRQDLASSAGISLIGGLEARLSLVDLASFSGDNNTAKLNSIFAQYKGKNVTLYSSVPATYTIDTDVTCYGNFDFSNLTFNLTGGKVIYADEREEAQRTKTITLTGYPLAELTSTLTSSDSLVGWENSLVKIVSPTEVDLYRLLNSVYTPRYKGEVNFMTKPGELAYSLKNTYNDPVTCTLFKLPTKRNKIVLPRFTGQFSRYAFDIQRSLVDVDVVYFNDMGMTITDTNIFGSSTTYGVNWKLTSAGITQTDNNSRYTVAMEYTLKHTFIGCEVGKGWRSIDGNYCRDTVVRDCVLDTFHLHYGSSMILIDNCRIPGGLSFGTGAFDEATQIINSHIGPFGIRTDYGEHKGDFIIRGGSVRIPQDKTGLVDLFLCRSDNVIASGNPVQPRTLHLPKNVIISTNIYWPDAVTLNIVSFKNNFKTQASPLRDFVMPDLIDFSGSTFNGKTARFEWALSYHDATTRKMTVVKLTPAKSTDCKVTAYVGYQAEYATCLYGLESNMDMTFMNITSGMNRSYIRMTNGIMRRFAGYSGGTTYMQGSVYFDKCFIDWDTGNNPVAGFTSFTDNLIDGTRAKGAAADKPIVNSYVNRSANNICYNIVATDTRDTVDKRYLLCTREGAPGNFSTGEIPVAY